MNEQQTDPLSSGCHYHVSGVKNVLISHHHPELKIPGLRHSSLTL